MKNYLLFIIFPLFILSVSLPGVSSQAQAQTTAQKKTEIPAKSKSKAAAESELKSAKDTLDGTSGGKACEPFPKVAWWGKISHKRVRRYVEKKHKGNWKPYIKKWERQLKTMSSIQDRGGSAVIKKMSIILKGPALEAYIKKIEQRLSITRCLSQVKNLK